MAIEASLDDQRLRVVLCDGEPAPAAHARIGLVSTVSPALRGDRRGDYQQADGQRRWRLAEE